MSAGEKRQNIYIPRDFNCPITSQLMKYPIIKKYQDKVDVIFNKLPSQQPRDLTNVQRYINSMDAYNDTGYGGCFDGGCYTYMEDGSSKEIRHLRKGDKVRTLYDGEEVYDEVECLLRTSAPPRYPEWPVRYRRFKTGLLITPWHPIQAFDPDNGTHCWQFPSDICSTVEENLVKYVYNIVLKNRTSTIIVNDIAVATLGHGEKGAVIEHKYFGDKIIDDLKQCESYSDGLVTISGFKRAEDTGLANGIFARTPAMCE